MPVLHAVYCIYASTNKVQVVLLYAISLYTILRRDLYTKVKSSYYVDLLRKVIFSTYSTKNKETQFNSHYTNSTLHGRLWGLLVYLVLVFQKKNAKFSNYF